MSLEQQYLYQSLDFRLLVQLGFPDMHNLEVKKLFTKVGKGEQLDHVIFMAGDALILTNLKTSSSILLGRPESVLLYATYCCALAPEVFK